MPDTPRRLTTAEEISKKARQWYETKIRATYGNIHEMDWNSSLFCLFYSCLWLFMKFTNMSLLLMTFMTYSYQTNITKSLSSRFMHEISASMAWASPRFTPCSNWMLARHCTTVKTSSRPVQPKPCSLGKSGSAMGRTWKDMAGLDSTENIRIVRNHQAANLQSVKVLVLDSGIKSHWSSLMRRCTQKDGSSQRRTTWRCGRSPGFV